MEDSNSVYNLLISSAAKGVKYGLAHPFASRQHNLPHLLTVSLKIGSKPSVNLSPFHVWFGAGTVRVSSFVCLVGIGLGIGTYIIYKIYKQSFPLGVHNSILRLLGRNRLKTDKNNAIASNSCSGSNQDVNEASDAIRRFPQNSEKQHRRRKFVKTKPSSPGTDSDFEVSKNKTTPSNETGVVIGIHRASGHSTDLGFVSMKNSIQMPSQVQKEGHHVKGQNARTCYSLMDDHHGNRFVFTPIDPNSSREERLHPSDQTVSWGFARHGRMQSTPDELPVEDDFLDLSELNSGAHQISRSSGPRDSKLSECGSDSDQTGISLSQPSSEMFEAVKDVALSGTLNEMENLQSQLDLLSNDVDDLNGEVENLQRREDPKETVGRRYTLGAEEALTTRKKAPKELNLKRENKSKSRFLRKLDFKNSLDITSSARSCDLLGSDHSEEGVMALVENADAVENQESQSKNSFVSNECSELERLSSDGSLSDVISFDDCKSLPGNKTFIIGNQSCGLKSTDSKYRKSKHDTTDDLYIDDDLLSPHNGNNPMKHKKSLQAGDMLSPTQLFFRPKSLTNFNESTSIYLTPEKSSTSKFLSPPPANENKMETNYNHLMNRSDHLNLLNNNISTSLISELLHLSSREGSLSPRTSNFLAAYLESPERASVNLDYATLRRYMEKIGEAVINCGINGAPLKRCHERTFSSTPVNCNEVAKEDYLKNLSSLDRLRISFPLWEVTNLGKPMDTLDYAGKKFCANTESHLYQGYAQICNLSGARTVCSIRKDNFCSIRAVLCQGILSNKLKSFSQMLKQDYKQFMQVFELPGNEFLKSSCFSNRIPFNKGSEMEIVESCFELLLSVIATQDEIHSKVHDLSQKQQQLKSLLDDLFNGCPIIDLYLMEAIKMIMMVKAIELYRTFSLRPSQSKTLAWAIYSGKLTQNPEQLFKNRMCAIGDTLTLNKVEISLLAHSLMIKLEILKPSLYLGLSEDFVSHYPDEDVDNCEKVTIIEEADSTFLLILQ